MLRYGYRVPQDIDGRLTWAMIHAHTRYAGPGTAWWTHTRGAAGEWGVTEHLLRLILDTARVANWQRTEDGARKMPRHYPEPIPYPGMPPGKGKSGRRRTTTVGNAKMTRAQVDRWLGWDRQPTRVPAPPAAADAVLTQ